MQNETDLLKMIITNQHDIYTDFSVYALAIVGIIAAGQFIIYIYVNKREITSLVSKLFSDLSSKLITDNEKLIKSELDSVMDKMKSEYRNELDGIHWENCRSTALHAQKEGVTDFELGWWLKSMFYAIRADMGPGIRISVEAIMRIYKDKTKIWDTQDIRELVNIKQIEKILPDFPSTLNEEKKIIIKIINLLKKKAP